MAMIPGVPAKAGAPGKFLGKSRASPGPGRGRAQPGAPGHAPAPGANAGKEAAVEPTLAAAAPVKVPAEQTPAAEASSSAQPARKGGQEVQKETSADRAARLLIAANGKRKSQLTPQMERSWHQLSTKTKHSDGPARPSNAANESAAAGDASEGATQGSLPAAEQPAEGPEPQIFSVQVSMDEDGAAQAPEEGTPGKGPAGLPSPSSGQQSSRWTPRGSRLSGLGGSFLPDRSPSSSKGPSKRSGPASSVTSRPNKRAKAPAGPPAVDSNGQQATTSVSAQPSTPEGSVVHLLRLSCPQSAHMQADFEV
jgi:hypothetical protein